ncbi:hypothetical protein H4582DRAFT_174950 [Lactarius indigo]|nr:hypothetical protein H4582DRAFT_174950 [Lactarius indigo]
MLRNTYLIWIYDIDDPWLEYVPWKHPERPEAVPLYYAIPCGFRWLIEHLIVTYPRDVNARGGYYGTPLLATIRKEDATTTSSPPQQGVGGYVLGTGTRVHFTEYRLVNAPTFCDCYSGITQVSIFQMKQARPPLDWAPASGELEVSRLLIRSAAQMRMSGAPMSRPQGKWDTAES